jgi:dipeptidyl aminopeptidase/acylaminoacyl peptidase
MPEPKPARPRIAPYGSWHSPISADSIVGNVVGLGRILLDGDMTYWVEQRPTGNARNVVVGISPDGQILDVTPDHFDVGTSVHEYGARGYTVDDGVVFFSNADDHRLYRQRPGSEPVPITPEGELRYAAMVVDRARQRVIAVREDHSTGADEPVNTIVSIDIEGHADPGVLVSGNDFYATPRLSADGRSLCWLAWDHPAMPWDGTELWMASFDAAGALGAPTRIAGGTPVSAGQPEWSPDGALYFLSDESGWWNLYRWRGEKVEPVLPMAAEFAKTYWWVGMNAYGFESASSVICSYGRHGVWQLGRLDLDSGCLDPLDVPYTAMGWGDLNVASGRAVFQAGSPSKPNSVLQLDLQSGELEILATAIDLQFDPGYLSIPEAIEFPTENGLSAHAFYYAPKNRDFAGPAGEKPPLLVTVHGGPTGAATLELDLLTQFWTSRGIAVLDVNYGGSTGFGAEYRERLIGEWGVVDVNDSCNGARFLVERGDVDENRLAISGGSAGGYTALAAMAFRDVFNAGASHFGVSDLEALLDGIHKFDTYSLEALVGPYPLYRQRYQERSPINYVEQLTCPVIFFQGLDDTIVPANQSELMFDVMRKAGVPTAYLAFEGEGHGFTQAKNIRRTLDAELYFYSRVFGFELASPGESVHIENADRLGAVRATPKP